MCFAPRHIDPARHFWPIRRVAALLLAPLLWLPAVAQGTEFLLTPIDFGDGVIITGQVTTDGTLGALSAANIPRWKIRVVSRSETVYSPANTHPSLSQVSSDGQLLQVATPADEFSDGGSLRFFAGSRYQAALADFGGAFAPEGQAFFVAGGTFDFFPLAQPPGVMYPVAQAAAPGGSVFDVLPIDFGDGFSLAGSITTNGAIGSLAASDILDWRIVVSEVALWASLTERNSQLFAADGLWTDGRTITVANPDGQWGFGRFPRPGGDPTVALLADFSGGFEGGQALFTFPLGSELLSPLSFAEQYVAATRVPEPGTALLAAVGLVAGGASRRRRRQCAARRSVSSGSNPGSISCGIQ